MTRATKLHIQAIAHAYEEGQLFHGVPQILHSAIYYTLQIGNILEKPILCFPLDLLGLTTLVYIRASFSRQNVPLGTSMAVNINFVPSVSGAASLQSGLVD